MLTDPTPVFTPSRDRQLLVADMLAKGYSLCEAFGCRFVVDSPVNADSSLVGTSFCGRHYLSGFCQLNLVCGVIVGDGLLYAHEDQQQPHVLDLFQLVVNSFQHSDPAGSPRADAVMLLFETDSTCELQGNWLRIEFNSNQKFCFEQTKAELDLQGIFYIQERGGINIPIHWEDSGKFAEYVACWFEQDQLVVLRQAVDMAVPPPDRLLRTVKSFALVPAV